MPQQFRPVDYAAAVGRGTQNALGQLQIQAQQQKMSDYQEDRPNVMRDMQVQRAISGFGFLEKGAKLVTDQNSYDAFRAKAEELGVSKPGELPPVYNPEMVSGLAGYAKKNLEQFGAYEQVPGAPEGTMGQRSLQTGKYANIKTPAAEPLVEVADPNSPTGTSFVRRSEAVGKPGKPPSSMKLKTTLGGGVEFTQGRGAALNKDVEKEASKRAFSAGESLARLGRIKKNYDPSFLTYQGKGERLLSSIKSKANIDLTQDEKQALRQHRRFSQAVNFEFNAYRKAITGAAAAVKELEDLKKAMVSTDLSPVEFEAAFNEYSRELQRSIRIRNRLLREGYQPGTKQFGNELDGLYLSGDDDIVDARGDELHEQGMTPQEIVDTLEKEGYL